ncbi:ATP-dependent DNA helicase RecG [Bacteroidia bacterium]|nr:ATP-dependent DNA helicase RecG [Bacteroidia bacterium]
MLDTPIMYIKSVGPQRANLLGKEIGVYFYEDLLNYLPFRYVDKSNYQKIASINSDSIYVLVRGKITKKEVIGVKNTARLSVRLTDDTGSIELVWFKNFKWINDNLVIGNEYTIFGKPNYFNGFYNFTHPEIENYTGVNPAHVLMPMYNTTETMKNRGLTSKTISKIVENMLAGMPFIPDILPASVIKENNLQNADTAYREIHFPSNAQMLAEAQRRFKFEELFVLQIRILREKFQNQTLKGNIFSKVADFFNEFYQYHLPFELTNAQKRVVKEIRNDMRTGFQMNRLLQGDVGSGKTLVALMSMLIAADNGFQSCMMAPTEILAQQHFNSISKFLEGMNIRVALLTGSTKQKDRRQLLDDLNNGTTHILIGTHAVIEDKVKFHHLGLCVIDEQHRFGVQQRSKLWKKSDIPPHILIMTATPIPRTLAMTLYGDLQCSVIDELPPNRKPITTVHLTENQRYRVIEFMRKVVAEGQQIYVVYPLIDESEALDLKALREGYEHISELFPLPEYHVMQVHGKMNTYEKDLGMRLFKEGKSPILVATTVIEVGVDVPNATVMIIENAERFGLSQLHQLRGRVGRGADKSYCLLMTKTQLSKDAQKRIDTMVATQDGFKISEVDMELRGPGNIQGTQQSGLLDFKLADLVADAPIVAIAGNSAQKLLNADPNLSDFTNQNLRNFIKEKYGTTIWSKIS